MKKSTILLLLLLVSMICGVSSLWAASWPGADGFGYTGQTATFSFVDITGTGTNLNLTDDSASGAQNLGFTFPFYGSNYTQVFASSNGFISFGSGSSSLTNQCPLPNSINPNDLIAVVWDDLLPSGTNNVYFQAFATCPVGPSVQCAIVEYGNVAYFSGIGSVTAEIILYPNGNILMQFQTVGQGGSSSTTGIENNNQPSDYGLTYACNTSTSVSNGTAILFSFSSLRTTSTTVSCTSPVTVNQAATCTATVTDTAGSGASAPTGTVTFSTDNTGSFGSNPCTLVAQSSDSSSCTSTYTPTVAGTHNIGAAYSGSIVHETSTDPTDFVLTADAATAVPTMNEWGMIIFMLLAGLGSVCYLRRRKRA